MNKFEPFPKNSPISKIFREIGYADELGSGMRNTNKYTKLYSGGTPIFVEDNIFEILIPIGNVAELRIGLEETGKETAKISKETMITSQKTDQKTSQKKGKAVKEPAKNICDFLRENPQMSIKELDKMTGLSTGGVKYHLTKLKNELAR